MRVWRHQFNSVARILISWIVAVGPKLRKFGEYECLKRDNWETDAKHQGTRSMRAHWTKIVQNSLASNNFAQLCTLGYSRDIGICKPMNLVHVFMSQKMKKLNEEESQPFGPSCPGDSLYTSGIYSSILHGYSHHQRLFCFSGKCYFIVSLIMYCIRTCFLVHELMKACRCQ